MGADPRLIALSSVRNLFPRYMVDGHVAGSVDVRFCDLPKQMASLLANDVTGPVASHPPAAAFSGPTFANSIDDLWGAVLQRTGVGPICRITVSKATFKILHIDQHFSACPVTDIALFCFQ